MHLVHWPRGPYASIYWAMLALNVLTPQLFWFARVRRSPRVLMPAAVAILVGMWLERFVIVVASLSRGSLASSWHDYAPTWVDVGLLAGSFGVFGLLFLVFLRFVPMAALGELRRHRFEMRTEAR
jgi:molybdopterin-containing oxidoreductase family membrane subunit